MCWLKDRSHVLSPVCDSLRPSGSVGKLLVTAYVVVIYTYTPKSMQSPPSFGTLRSPLCLKLLDDGIQDPPSDEAASPLVQMNVFLGIAEAGKGQTAPVSRFPEAVYAGMLSRGNKPTQRNSQFITHHIRARAPRIPAARARFLGSLIRCRAKRN
jgi:hypothetical protein